MAQGMQKRFIVTVLFGCITIFVGSWFIWNSPKTIKEYVEVAVEPRIRPDYSNIVIPFNIAPINFRILDEGRLCV